MTLLGTLTRRIPLYPTRESDYWKVPSLRLTATNEMLRFQVTALLNYIDVDIDLTQLSATSVHLLNDLAVVVYCFLVIII